MFKAASGYWRCISWTLGSWKVGKPSSLQGVLNYIISFVILAWLSGGNFVKLTLIISPWNCWLIQGFLWRRAACIWRRCWWSLTLRVGQWSACFCSSTWIVRRESIPCQSPDTYLSVCWDSLICGISTWMLIKQWILLGGPGCVLFCLGEDYALNSN